MAISSYSDWSLACIHSCSHRNSHILTLIPTCKTLPFFPAISCSKVQNFQVNTTGCSSPILEDGQEASSNLPVIELNVPFQDSKQNPVPDSEKLNGFLRGLFGSPQTEDLAFEYYEKMKGSPEFRPEKSTLQHVIRYLLRSKKWRMILVVCDDFKNYNVLPDSSTCSKLVSSCIRARKFKIVETLLEVFKSNGKVSVLAFGSAIRGYNKLHMYRSTIVALGKMRSAGVVLDSECSCHIMEAYMRLGDSDKVVELFCELESSQLDFYSSPFCTRIYGTLIESLGKSGRAFEALEYFKEMTRKGISKDSSIYSSLICSFASLREVKVAEDLFEEGNSKQMLRDPGLYLKLVLMYVKEGLMEKTLEIVKAMKSSKLRISDCIF